MDTDVLTLYQLGDPAIVRRVQALPSTQLAVALISVEEELTGWYTRLRRARKRDHLAAVYHRLTRAIRFLARLEILTFSEPAIVRFEQLRASHRRQGKNDLRIAAIVLEEGAVLATRNVRDFKQINGLEIEGEPSTVVGSTFPKKTPGSSRYCETTPRRRY
jgi:tRNA(fMet)-specific endonuclease VapC